MSDPIPAQSAVDLVASTQPRSSSSEASPAAASDPN
jgi:hypothetical protein